MKQHRDYVQEQKDNNDPIKIAAKKELAAAQKALEKNKKYLEQEAAKNQKAAEAEKERIRKRSLTPHNETQRTIKKIRKK